MLCFLWRSCLVGGICMIIFILLNWWLPMDGNAFINCFLWAGGCSYYRRGSAEISAKAWYIYIYVYYLLGSKLVYSWVDIFCLASPWMESGKLGPTQGHAAVATCRPFPGRGVTDEHRLDCCTICDWGLRIYFQLLLPFFQTFKHVVLFACILLRPCSETSYPGQIEWNSWLNLFPSCFCTYRWKLGRQCAQYILNKQKFLCTNLLFFFETIKEEMPNSAAKHIHNHLTLIVHIISTITLSPLERQSFTF